jgi:hypothetical protein
MGLSLCEPPLRGPTRVLSQAWYGFSSGSTVFLLPYLWPFLRSRGLTDAQLGLLALWRPLLASCGQLVLAPLGDSLACHTPLTVRRAALSPCPCPPATHYCMHATWRLFAHAHAQVALFAASVLLRALTYYMASAPFPALLASMLLSEFLAAPVNSLMDARVTANLVGP